MITQKMLESYKHLSTLSSILEKEAKTISKEIGEKLANKEDVEEGVWNVILEETSRASLSKDKIVSAFSSILNKETVERLLGTIPKTSSSHPKVGSKEETDYMEVVEDMAEWVFSNPAFSKDTNENQTKAPVFE